MEPPERPTAEFEDLPRSGFFEPGPFRDELARLVREGIKTATSTLVADYVGDPEVIPYRGYRWVATDTSGRMIVAIETTDCRIVTLAQIDDAFAIDYGEGYANAIDWRIVHIRSWNSSIDEMRAALWDPTFAIGDGTLIVAERFKVIASFAEGRDVGDVGYPHLTESRRADQRWRLIADVGLSEVKADEWLEAWRTEGRRRGLDERMPQFWTPAWDWMAEQRRSTASVPPSP